MSKYEKLKKRIEEHPHPLVPLEWIVSYPLEPGVYPKLLHKAPALKLAGFFEEKLEGKEKPKQVDIENIIEGNVVACREWRAGIEKDALRLVADFYIQNHLWFWVGSGQADYGYPVQEAQALVPGKLRDSIDTEFKATSELLDQQLMTAFEWAIRRELRHAEPYCSDGYCMDLTETELDKLLGYPSHDFDHTRCSMEDARKLFANETWEDDYGGEMWHKATQAYIDLARKLPKMKLKDKTVAIDTIFDMQHNTGSLLSNTEFALIDKELLDLRANATDIGVLTPFCSKKTKELLQRSKRYLPINASLQQYPEQDDIVLIHVQEDTGEELRNKQLLVGSKKEVTSLICKHMEIGKDTLLDMAYTGPCPISVTTLFASKGFQEELKEVVAKATPCTKAIASTFWGEITGGEYEARMLPTITVVNCTPPARLYNRGAERAYAFKQPYEVVVAEPMERGRFESLYDRVLTRTDRVDHDFWDKFSKTIPKDTRTNYMLLYTNNYLDMGVVEKLRDSGVVTNAAITDAVKNVVLGNLPLETKFPSHMMKQYELTLEDEFLRSEYVVRQGTQGVETWLDKRWEQIAKDFKKTVIER